MAAAWFEPKKLSSEEPKTHASGRAATKIGSENKRWLHFKCYLGLNLE